MRGRETAKFVFKDKKSCPVDEREGLGHGGREQERIRGTWA